MKRIREIDGLRGMAILMVLIWHFYFMVVTAHSTLWLKGLDRVFDLCWSGVDLFFVISGFLITSILLRAQKSPRYFTVFYLRRACRIWPLYYFFILLFLVAQNLSWMHRAPYLLLIQDPMPLWSYLTFTQNYFIGMRAMWGPFLLAVTWSLAVEEQFYMGIPFLVKYWQRQHAILLVAFVVLMAVAFRYLWPGFGAYVYTMSRADSLFSGVLLAYAVAWPGFMLWADQVKRKLLVVGVILGLGYFLLSGWGDPMATFDFPARMKHGPLIHLYLALFYSLIILLVILRASLVLNQFLRSSFLVFSGIYSYGIYLFHPLVFVFMAGALGKKKLSIDAPSDLFFSMVSFALTFGLAWLSYHSYEKIFLKLGARFRY